MKHNLKNLLEGIDIRIIDEIENNPTRFAWLGKSQRRWTDFADGYFFAVSRMSEKKEGFEKELRERVVSLGERLKEQPYPYTNLDSLILHAGIGLVEEILGDE